MGQTTESKRLHFRHLLILISSVVGGLSFPGADQGWMAWIAFLPLFLYGECVSGKREFLLGVFVSEVIKWIWLVLWLRHVTWIGVFGIAIVMATIHLMWFWSYWELRGSIGSRGRLYALTGIVSLGMLWSSLEWLRTMPFGMPGAPLSITQWVYPALLPICSIIGGYGLSAVIVIFNLALFFGGIRFWKNGWKFHECIGGMWILAVLLLSCVILYGKWILRSHDPEPARETMKVAFVQPYQPAYRYWTRERVVDAVETVFRLSGSASDSDFDLMVWPEGTLPFPIYEGSDMDYEVSNLVSNRIQRPLLLGNQSELGERSYNAVFYYNAEGVLGEEFYAKNILVPFGEYIPLRKFWGFLETIVPIPEDFSRGEKMNVLPILVKNKTVNISALICYEDCFPRLAVEASRNGAEILYVATYDVWYGEEFAAYMHAAHSVIRAAEIRRPVFRCGSGGWSGYIDEFGRVIDVVKNQESGSIYYRGVQILEVEIPADQRQTIFVKYYDLIITIMLIAGGCTFVMLWVSKRKESKR